MNFMILKSGELILINTSFSSLPIKPNTLIPIKNNNTENEQNEISVINEDTYFLKRINIKQRDDANKHLSRYFPGIYHPPRNFAKAYILTIPPIVNVIVNAIIAPFIPYLGMKK